MATDANRTFLLSEAPVTDWYSNIYPLSLKKPKQLQLYCTFVPTRPPPLHLQSPFLLIILVFTSGSGSIDFKGIKKRKKISSNNVNFLNLYSLKRNKIGKKGNDIKWLPLVIWVSFDSFPNYCHCNKLAQINIKQTCVIISKTRSDL